MRRRFPILLLLLATSSLGAAQEATFTPLGSPLGGDFYSFAGGVSPDGRVVVGQGGGADPGPFRWENGVFEMLIDPDSGFGKMAWAASYDGSVVVGLASLPTGIDEEAVRWESGTSLLLGDFPGGRHSSEAFDVSYDGAIAVGVGETEDGLSAFHWENGIFQALPDLSGGINQSIASAVSADGSVVSGYGYGPQGIEAVRWIERMAEGLGFPQGAHSTIAQDVSADGTVVVGRASASSPSVTLAFIWREGIGMEELPDLPGGGLYREAQAVSGDGRVVLGSADGADGLGPFIWTEDMGIRPFRDFLTELGVDLTGWSLSGFNRHALSHDGRVIVGNGTNPNGDQEAWRVELPPWPVAQEPEAPGATALTLSVLPNPVRSQASVRLVLPEPSRVRVTVTDVLGRSVARVHGGTLAAGWHTFSFEASGLSAGVYVVRAETAQGAVSRRVTVLR